MSASTASTAESPPSAPARILVHGPWELHEYDEVGSTNLVCSTLSAWHAVRARSQTAGRGRFQRPWVSDQGGLWLSAVLPAPQDSAKLRLSPLAAGLAVCEALQKAGATGLRLRWPNDVLVGDRKLAGLLLDQFIPSCVVVGVGVNVLNRPEDHDPSLRYQVVRLADIVKAAPSLPELAYLLLDCLADVWSPLATVPVEAFLSRLDSLWQAPRPVQIQLESGLLHGQFLGVDPGGRLKLQESGGQISFLEPHDVRLLRDSEHP